MTRGRYVSWPGVWIGLVVLWALQVVFVLPGAGPRMASSGQEPAVSASVHQADVQAIDALTPPQALPSGHGQPVRPRVAAWVDAGAQASLADVRAQLHRGAFRAASLPMVGGFNRQAYWYALHWRRTDAQQGRWLLTVGQPYLDDVQVHVQRAGGPVQRWQMGDRYLSEERPVQARWHVIGVNLDPGEDVVLWVRVASGGVIHVDMTVDTPGQYFASELSLSAILGVFMGILVLAAFTYLIVGVWLRDGMLLAYGAFLVSLFMLYMGQNGLLIQLAGTPPWWLSDLFAGVGSLGPWYAATLMWSYALELNRHHPRLDRLYKAAAWFFAAALPLVFTRYYGALSQLSFVLGLGMSPLTLALTWMAWRRTHDRLTMTYVVAMVMYLLGSYITLAYLLKLLPAHPLFPAAQPMLTLAHTLVMGVALAMRIGRIRSDNAEAAQRAEAHRSFVAMLTHEFRNPLSGIDRSANLIQAMSGERGGPVHTRVANIRQQARRLNTLVDSFLLVRDDGALPTAPQLTRVHLRTWLDSLRQSMGADMAARVHLSLPPEHLEVMLDPRLIQLAINNLLDNALRYSPDGAQVTLSACAMPDGGCEIAVTDQGPGLDDQALARLGEPYHRGANASGSQGTGLGYYFCRQLVEAHGGSVTPSRAQPRGLCVTVRLPAP